MFKKLTTATLLLSALCVSGLTQAAEGSIDLLVESMVADAAQATKLDISYDLQEAVLTVNHMITIEQHEGVYATSTRIIDIQQDDSSFETKLSTSE